MALSSYALPFGLRDVKLFPMNQDGSYGTGVDLPASRSFEFQEAEDFEELRGDDIVITSRGSGPNVEWSLESGGISLEALKILIGGTITQSGVTPNVKKTFAKNGTDARPYFKVEGQVISDSGGDIHCTVYRCRVDGNVGGTFEDGSFFLTGADGKGFADSTDKLYKFEHNETAAAITP
jgi:hypothetical protein